MKRLNVYLHSSLTGILEQDKHGRTFFTYSEKWLQSEKAVPISLSLPLREEPFSAKECLPFFGGILPENENRKLISHVLGISNQNDFAMLDRIGGECAGAITFLPEDSSLPPITRAYTQLSEVDLAAIIGELPDRPLLAGKKDIRLSLAGAQTKVAVHVKDGTISLPKNGSPSTHILKPANPRFKDLVQNEYFCMQLAQKIGLSAAQTSIGTANEHEYLLIERYDRYRNDEEDNVRRLHQEDFCQALSCPSIMKYQSEGGPSLTQCFDLVRKASNSPALDLIKLLDAVTFNVLIGNNDAHAKNFSFIYTPPDIVRLAPLYDLVSTAYYSDLSPNMAMKIGGKYLPRKLRAEHWQAFWTEAGLSGSQAKKRTLSFMERVEVTVTAWPDHGHVASTIATDIGTRIEFIRKTIS